MTFAGFPHRTRFTPVPNPLFGPLLEQIEDLAELKCTLRIIWLLHQKKGYPRFVALNELMADRTLGKALNGAGDRRTELDRVLSQAVRRRTLLTGTVSLEGGRERVYALNTDSDRRAMAKLLSQDESPQEGFAEQPYDAPTDRPNIFTLYEENIGLLSPMIAEELREAEQLYPLEWIGDAVREAVDQNKRSWRYVSRILERWEREGRSSDGRAGRYSKKTGHKRYY